MRGWVGVLILGGLGAAAAARSVARHDRRPGRPGRDPARPGRDPARHGRDPASHGGDPASHDALRDCRESLALLQSVLGHAVDVSYRRNLLTDRYDYLSPATRPVLGIDPETLWGLSIERLLERIHPDDRDRVQAAMVRGQEQGRGGVEYRFRGDDGRYRWVGDHFTVQRDAAGTPVTRIGIVRDLSVRKALEAERDRERALLETVLEALPTGVLIADAEGRIIRDNPAARELWGVPPETGSWREYGEWVAWWPGTGERIRAEEWALSRAILEGEETRNELVQNQPFGGDERRHYLNNVTPLRDGEGRIIGGVAAMLDVTERLAAERELRDAKERAEAALARAENAEQRLRTVFEEAPVVLAVLEGPGHVIRIQNEAHRALFGGRSGVGIPVAEALPELEEQGFRELLDRVYRTGERYVGHEIRGRIDVTGTGGFEERYFNFVNEPLRDREGAVTGILSVAVDVTESVRARQAAEVASRAKTQFFSVMSHEIRTPLNAVLGYTNLLRDGVPDEPSDTQRKYLDRIAASGSHLLTLINDVLDLAKIEAGRLRVRLERILLGGVLHEAVSVAEPLLRGKGLAFELRPSGEPLEVWGDESRIRQVLVNLLSNAAKFTERGQVRLQVRVHAERPEAAELPGDGPWVGIAVEDTGVGIPGDRLEEIFEPFIQVDRNPYTRTHEGTGLGLGISRRLARMMGGDVTVESEPGAGSTFTLWLTRATPEDTGPPERRRGEDRRSGEVRRTGDRRADD